MNRAVVAQDGKSLLVEMGMTVPPPPSEDKWHFIDLRYYWCLVDATTGKQRWRTDEVKQTDAMAISPDGTMVACGTPGKIHLRNAQTGALLFDFDTSGNYAKPWQRQAGALAFTPDSKKLIAGDHRTNVFVWNVATGKQLHRFAGHLGRVFSVSASPDSTMLATASEDSTILLWRLGAEKSR
jgi:WD40 repeat protein